MEVMVGAHPSQEMGTREVLDDFELLPVSIVVAEKAVILRKERRLKLPDAVILATAMSAGWVLVSRNTKDFLDEPGVIRNPYTL